MKRMTTARFLFVGILLALVLGDERPVLAQNLPDCAKGTNAQLLGFDDETITVSSTAIGFTQTKWNPGSGGAAWGATCTIAADNIRVWYGGTTPTATVGQLYVSGGSFSVCNVANSFAKFKMIRQTTDATVSCSYFRPPQ